MGQSKWLVNSFPTLSKNLFIWRLNWKWVQKSTAARERVRWSCLHRHLSFSVIQTFQRSYAEEKKWFYWYKFMRELLLYWMLSHVCCYSFLGLLSWLFIGDWWCWCHHKCLVSVQRTEGKAGQESEVEAKLTTSTPLQDQQEAEGVRTKPLVFMYGSLWMPILKQKYLIK